MTALILSALIATGNVPGPIMMVGGGTTTPAMVSRFLQLAGGQEARILILPFMREEPAVTGPGSVELLKSCGARTVSIVSNVPTTPWERRLLAREILASDGLWLPGGNQNLFIERLGLDWCRKVFASARDRGIAFFGTSAGAMLMSDTMIGGNATPGIPVRARGLGLVPFVVDTHYRERDRRPRLQFALTRWQVSAGVGLSEGEWIIWNGKLLESSGKPEWLTHSPDGASSSSRASWSLLQASIR